MNGSTSTTERPAAQVEWLPFAGTAERRAASFRLTAHSGNGYIELGEDDVGFDTVRSVFVRKGTILTDLVEPRVEDFSGRSAVAEIVAAECPHAVTSCIGAVLICCGERQYRVIGTAMGSWGCSKFPFNLS